MSLAVLLAACTPEPATTDPEPSAPPTAETADTATSDPTDTTDTSTTPPADPVLVVSSYFSGTVHVFDNTTGVELGVVTGVDGAQTVVPSATGEWIACAELKNQIVRIDPETLTVVGVLVGDDPGTPEDETGGLRNPDAAIFGPDGRLYVSSFETDQILRYEADGTFVDVFVAAGAGGLDGPDIGLGFAPNGELLVPGWYSHQVHRYDPGTGASLGTLVGPDDGLDSPRAIAFDASGRAYVSGWGTNGVLRHDPTTGETVHLLTAARATGLVLDEAAGEVLVANGVDGVVRAFALETGDPIGARASSATMDGVTAIAFLLR